MSLDYPLVSETAATIAAAESGENVSLAKSRLENIELEKLKTKLQNLMKHEKPYLAPQLTLRELAKRSGLNTSILSAVINQGFGKNFNDFVNSYRIAEVKKKLLDEKARNSTLIGIALECGFNSKATFNRAFKKITGFSPKEFEEQEN